MFTLCYSVLLLPSAPWVQTFTFSVNSGGGRVETVNWKVTKSFVSSSVDRAITVKVEANPSVAFSKTESRTRKSAVELLPTVTVGESKKYSTNPETDVSMFSVKLASPPLLKIVIVTDALSPGCNTKNPVSLSPGLYKNKHFYTN